MKNTLYKKTVRETFSFLKSSNTILDAYLRSIPVEDKGFLVPAGQVHLQDASILNKLKHLQRFFVDTEHQPVTLSAQDYLQTDILSIEDSMLFWLTNTTGEVVGHIGFRHCINDQKYFELSYLAHEGHPDLFSKALYSLLEWTRKTIDVEGFFIKINRGNSHARSYYLQNGFIEDAGSSNVIQMFWKPERTEIGKTMILTAGPSISAKEAVYTYDAALYGWNRNWSKYLTKFEETFAQYIGVKYAIATSSCTGALQIALMALGIGPGDEVIVPDLTWVATANAVKYVGATPIFSDIDAKSWTIDPQSFESLITPKTKAVIPVHLYGHPAHMDRIKAIADQYRLYVIEDAAPAIGAEWKGRRCGSFGDFSAFSFQGAKLLVTGEGGMLTTNDEELYKKAYKIWDQGRNPALPFFIDGDGVKFKMSNVSAAIGLGQIERVNEQIEMKRRIFHWYEQGLSNTPYLKLQREHSDAKSIYWLTNILLDENSPISRDELMQLLKSKNVDTRPVFPTISQYPIWSYRQSAQPTAANIAQRAMNLPSGVCLSKDEVMYICNQIQTSLRT